MPHEDGLTRPRGNEIDAREHEPNILSKRVVLIDTDGNGITAENPLPVSATMSTEGIATSAKQLPDNHQVAVSNMIPAVETGLATAAKQDTVNTNITSVKTVVDTLNSLTETMQELIQRLAPLGSVIQHGAQSLRVTAPVALSVSGPITSAQYVAAELTDKIARSNLTATIANINNCTGA